MPRQSTPPQKIVDICEQCGEPYYRHRPSRPGRYCSKKCTNIAKIQPLDIRFWSKVRKTSGCWWWLPGAAFDGYGKFWYNGRDIHPHRLAWELVNGPMPPELVARHKCDNKLCVRPDHIVPGTHADNSRDMAERGRAASGKRHGSQLHPERVARGERHRSRTSPETLKRGAEHGMAKLSEAEVIAIRGRAATGERYAGLAREYGVSSTTVSYIVKRRIWKHVA